MNFPVERSSSEASAAPVLSVTYPEPVAEEHSPLTSLQHVVVGEEPSVLRALLARRPLAVDGHRAGERLFSVIQFHIRIF